ncbi:GPI-specific phospholipase A2-like PGAP3 isoform X2 [Clavelina lepadiformis]|uniref:GPI-specific phospholipase A2-like PGAP3 isoform X2 n=1 Tax=Clavelina lepadiformis TaxID=159417 RepID=UPI0040433817
MQNKDKKSIGRYSCMWQTVERYKATGRPVPQFYGKWPFLRLFGLQEPASVLFSIFNGVSSIFGFIKYSRRVPSNAPMHIILSVQIILTINAWLWSTVFHGHDFPWTEKLDYFSATSIVIFSIYVFIHRVTIGISSLYRVVLRSCFGMTLIIFYVTHIYYLSSIKFDYGYNMIVNIMFGLLGSVAWLCYCFLVWKRQPYVFKMIACILLTNVFLCLEVFDFPPLFWILDAHSIWHLLTIPLPLLYYSFFTDDSFFVYSRSEVKNKLQ